jgi:hypothetical protein
MIAAPLPTCPFRRPPSSHPTHHQPERPARASAVFIRFTLKDPFMAKSQKKSNKEIRKPKAAKVKTNASNPSDKAGVVAGLEHMKTGRGK